MVNWLLKKTRDPVTELTKEQYEALSSESVSIVYHGDLSAVENAQILTNIAMKDDYNTYYFVKESGKEQGTVEILRNFAESVSYNAIDDGLAAWVSKNQRPTIVNFDDRTIGEIFGEQKLGFILFNSEGNNILLNDFTEAAK